MWRRFIHLALCQVDLLFNDNFLNTFFRSFFFSLFLNMQYFLQHIFILISISRNVSYFSSQLHLLHAKFFLFPVRASFIHYQTPRIVFKSATR